MKHALGAVVVAITVAAVCSMGVADAGSLPSGGDVRLPAGPTPAPVPIQAGIAAPGPQVVPRTMDLDAPPATSPSAPSPGASDPRPVPPTDERDAGATPPVAAFSVDFAVGSDPSCATPKAWPAPAKTSFMSAAAMWSNAVSSSVPIRVRAVWCPMGQSNILGGAGAAQIHRDFSNAPRAGFWYPDALANALAATDLDPSRPEIFAVFNADFGASSPIDWYFGTDGAPGSYGVDFRTVVAHELGHGLGFFGGLTDSGPCCTTAPFAFDALAETASGTPLLSLPNPSPALTHAMHTEVRLDAPTASRYAGRLKLYTPQWWEPGSSYSHLDDLTYSSMLMTPFQQAGEAQTEIDFLTVDIMHDLGWRVPKPAPGAVPAPPTAVPIVRGATVSWPAITNASIYGWVSYDLTVSPGNTVIPVPYGWTQWTVHGLTPGMAYTFSVRAVTNAGTGPPTASPPTSPLAGGADGLQYHPVPPFRTLDSRTNSGFRDPVGAAATKSFSVGYQFPAEARAVVMSVTVTNATELSYLTLWPSGQPRPLAANLVFTPGQTVTNLVTVAVGVDDRVSVFNQRGSVNVIADAVGYYDDDPSGAGFVPLPSSRVLDSRTIQGGWSGPLSGTERSVTIAGSAGVPIGTPAVVMNVTVTQATEASYLAVAPSCCNGANGTASVLFGRGQTVSTLVITKLDEAGKAWFSTPNGSVHVVADVVGYFDSAGGLLFHTLNPTRMIDDRTGVGGYTTPWSADTDRLVTLAGTSPIPLGAQAVVMNLTATNGTAAGSFLTVAPDATSAENTASLLFGRQETRPNLVMSGIDPLNGAVHVYNQRGDVSVVGDVSGYFSVT